MRGSRKGVFLWGQTLVALKHYRVGACPRREGLRGICRLFEYHIGDFRQRAVMNVESMYLNCLALFGVGGAHPGGLNLTKKILAKEELDESTRVLDAGCGTGQTSAYIARQYQCHVTALDFNKIMLEKARQRFQSMNLPIETRYGNAEDLPFDDSSFDLLLAESVTAFTDISKTIPEFKRVLKPNGVLLAIEMVRDMNVSEEQLKDILEFYGVTQLLQEGDWRALFKEAGFKQIEAEKVNLQPDTPHMQVTNDFSLSKHIDPAFYQVFEKHHHYSMMYKGVLGCRVFRCIA